MTEGSKTDKINKLREEIYLKIKDHDKSSDTNYKNLQNNIDIKLDSFEKIINQLNSQIKSIQSGIISDGDKNEKIRELSHFKDATERNQLNMNLKLNSITTDVANTTIKVNQIIKNNLEIPGAIGESCKFNNLKEYIEVYT